VVKDLNNLIKTLNKKSSHIKKSKKITKMGLSIFKIGKSKNLFEKFIDEITWSKKSDIIEKLL